MARFFDGTDDYLRHDAAIVTAVPVTLSCWFRKTIAETATYTLVNCLNSANVSDLSNNFSLTANNQAADDAMFIGARTNNRTATGIVAVPVGTWVHICGVFATTSSRICYLNGTQAGTQGNTATPSGINRFSVGVADNAASSGFTEGDIAEVAIHNAALDAAEVAALARGLSPDAIRPASLVAYYPLDGRFSPERDPVGKFELTVNGATYTDHPRVFYSLPQMSIGVPQAGGGGNQTGTPDVGTVTLSGISPSALGAGTGSTIPDTPSVAVTGISPAASGTGTATTTPDAATVTLTGVSPTGTGSGTVTVTPDVATITLSTIDATAISTSIGTAEVATVTVTGTSPIGVGQGTATATPDVSTVTVTSIPLTASPSGNVTGTPDVSTISISGTSSSASGSGTVTVTPDVGTVTITGTSPSASPVGTVTTSPSFGTVTVEVVSPSATPVGTATASPVAATVTLLYASPVALGQGTITTTATVGSVSVSGFSVTASNVVSNFLPVTDFSLDFAYNRNFTLEFSYARNFTLDY